MINCIVYQIDLLIGYLIVIVAPRLYTYFQLVVYYHYYRIILSIFSGLYIYMLYLWVHFNNLEQGFQFLYLSSWFDSWGISLLIGVDGLSIYFLILTAFIFVLCSLITYKISGFRLLLSILLLMDLCLLIIFSILDLFLFSYFFESLIILIFYLIVRWGSRKRRVKALGYFIIYTLFGSVFLFVILFMTYYEIKTFNVFILMLQSDKLILLSSTVWWGCLFIVFAIKLPIIPFHLWLPEAHVEAPTIGSIILAGLLLKIGGYGILRFLMLDFRSLSYYKTLILLFALYSIILSSCEALRQSDLKKIIAYSSIAHINIGVIGLVSYTEYGILANLLLIISHGFIASGLFFIIGVVYERTH